MRVSLIVELSALVALAVLAAPCCAEAQQAAPSTTMQVGDGYFGVEGGVILPQSVSTHISGAIGGVGSTFSGNVSFSPGQSFGVVAGYSHGGYLAIEGEFLYSGFNFNQANGTVTGFAATRGSFSASGSIDTEALLVNVILSPFGRSGIAGFKPYVGGGIGGTVVNGTLGSLTVDGTTAAVGGGHSENDFTADAILGFDYPVTETFSVGGRYRFLWVDVSDIVAGGGFVGSNGSLMAHELMLDGTWRF